MDLAVGVIIGAAFAKIVDSMVKDLIMPVVGKIFGGLDFSNYFIMLADPPAGYNGPRTYEALTKAGVPLFAYGNFITVAINFIILAFIIFVMVKQINRLKRQAPPPRRPRKISCCCGKFATRSRSDAPTGDAAVRSLVLPLVASAYRIFRTLARNANSAAGALPEHVGRQFAELSVNISGLGRRNASRTDSSRAAGRSDYLSAPNTVRAPLVLTFGPPGITLAIPASSSR